MLIAYSGGYELHSLYRSFVGLWVNAVVIGYIVGWPLFPMLAADVEQLTPAMEPPDRSLARTQLSEAWSNRGVWIARGIGIIFGLFLSAQAGIDALAGRPQFLAYVWVPVVVPLLWATILPALWRLIRVSLFVWRLGSRVRIDLGNTRVCRHRHPTSARHHPRTVGDPDAGDTHRPDRDGRFRTGAGRGRYPLH